MHRALVLDTLALCGLTVGFVLTTGRFGSDALAFDGKGCGQVCVSKPYFYTSDACISYSSADCFNCAKVYDGACSFEKIAVDPTACVSAGGPTTAMRVYVAGSCGPVCLASVTGPSDATEPTGTSLAPAFPTLYQCPN